MNKCREILNKCVFYFSYGLVYLYTSIFGNVPEEIKEVEKEVEKKEEKEKKQTCYYCEIKFIPVEKKSIVYNKLNFCSVPCMLQHISKPYL